MSTDFACPFHEVRMCPAECDSKVECAIGYDADGAEYFASSIADGADVLWLLERLKQQLLTTGAEANEV